MHLFAQLNQWLIAAIVIASILAVFGLGYWLLRGEITGRKFFVIIASFFVVIMGVNFALAYFAVATFPGLEVKNSYVASQSFDRDRDAQEALGWQVSARVEGDRLRLEILEDGAPIAPKIESAVFGRATNVSQDQFPEFTFEGDALYAPIQAGPGNWNLRLKARAENGTLFQQRVIVSHP